MPPVGTGISDGDRARPALGSGRAVKFGAYLALFFLGAVEALVGSFQYSRGPGSLVAICFALAILATCLLGSWGMRTSPGGVLPAAGWVGMSVLLGTSTSGGSVLVADTTQGKWFLFGGTICAAAGAVISFAKWMRPRRDRTVR
jgi:uncharacterized protein DUF6113